MQESLAITIQSIDACAGRQQDFHHRNSACDYGILKRRRASFAMLCIDIGSMLNQELANLCVAGPRRREQWRATECILRVGIDALGEQPRDFGQFSAPYRGV